jgi:hypothetical protein
MLFSLIILELFLLKKPIFLALSASLTHNKHIPIILANSLKTKSDEIGAKS